jgi:hypothetical protein
MQRSTFIVSPGIDKMLSDCAGMLKATILAVTAVNLSQATATLSSLTNCKVQFPCEMYSDEYTVSTSFCKLINTEKILMKDQ